jgi:ribokinase
VRCPDQATGCAFICVADNAENAITVAPGANLRLQSQHLPDLQGISHLLMQLEIPIATVTAYARRAQARGVQVVLNAAPAQALPPELMRAVDLLVVNEGELRALVTEGATVASMVQQLDVPTVVVTLGQRGCIARQHDDFVLQPAFRISPLDTTAAGDTFCGTLVAHLGRGETLTRALRTASAAAALACTASGAQSSIPTAAAVDNFLQQQPMPDQTQIEALANYCGLAAN